MRSYHTNLGAGIDGGVDHVIEVTEAVEAYRKAACAVSRALRGVERIGVSATLAS
jgi:hypothetical protein